jgi:hypothetical protein
MEKYLEEDYQQSDEILGEREQPERKLWNVVLQQAIKDLSRKNKKTLIRDNAYAWFTEDRVKFPFKRHNTRSRWDGKGCDPEIGSFDWICSVLNLDPNLVRKKVLNG